MVMQRRILLLGLALLMLFGGALPAGAAAFADPAFQRQWEAGEATAPNVWGPVANALPGQWEPYTQAQDGSRLVQYFDKGRMELTNGVVTNGLLATELVTGRVQVGDNAFENRPPPAIPVAGDPNGGGPTYATLAATGALFADAAENPAAASVYAFDARGTLLASAQPAGALAPPLATAAFDGPTRHNVIAAFAAYRATVGIATVGYARSEPFRATVTVAGMPRLVVIQVFERRVLTYTESNPDAFKVEMGNIGQHYARWRYPAGPPPATVAAPPSPAAPASGALDSEEADFLARINAYRSANGLGSLTLSPTLTRAAEWMSADMAANRYFDHTDSEGRDAFQRMCAFGYCAQTYKAENLAAGEATGAKTFEQWKNSPGHDANMRNPNYTVIGIARAPAAPGDPYGWYWTTDFGGVPG